MYDIKESRAMDDLTYSTLEGNRADFYRTTPFEFDSSAAALSGIAIVTTTISEPVAKWASATIPIVLPLETPETAPSIDKIRFPDQL
jgi:hypothetical protein